MNTTPGQLVYRKHRGGAWIAARVGLAIPASIVLGMIFGVLSGLAMAGGRITAGDAVEIFFIVGGTIGAVTAPALMLVATSRNALDGAIVVSAATSGAAVASGLLVRVMNDALILNLVITIGVYVVGCLMWRSRAGSAAWIEIPGACWKCGYDLKGLSADTCPECGAHHVVREFADSSY